MISSFNLNFITLFYQIKLTTHCLHNWAMHCATSAWTGLKLSVSQHTMTHNRNSKLPWRWPWLRPWLGHSTIPSSSSSWQKLNPPPLLLTSLCDGSTRWGGEGWGTTIVIRAPEQRMLAASCQIQTLSNPPPLLIWTSTARLFHPIRHLPWGDWVLALTHQKLKALHSLHECSVFPLCWCSQ